MADKWKKTPVEALVQIELAWNFLPEKPVNKVALQTFVTDNWPQLRQKAAAAKTVNAFVQGVLAVAKNQNIDLTAAPRRQTRNQGAPKYADEKFNTAALEVAAARQRECTGAHTQESLRRESETPSLKDMYEAIIKDMLKHFTKALMERPKKIVPVPVAGWPSWPEVHCRGEREEGEHLKTTSLDDATEPTVKTPLKPMEPPPGIWQDEEWEKPRKTFTARGPHVPTSPQPPSKSFAVLADTPRQRYKPEEWEPKHEEQCANFAKDPEKKKDSRSNEETGNAKEYHDPSSHTPLPEAPEPADGDGLG